MNYPGAELLEKGILDLKSGVEVPSISVRLDEEARAALAQLEAAGLSRFGVVVQARELLPRSTVLVVPTSRSARSASFRPEIEIEGEVTKVLAEQVGAVDVSNTEASHRKNLLIAAAAESAQVALLHYDHDYDLIAEVTGQPTRWLINPGSV